jgi:hypothetical protein
MDTPQPIPFARLGALALATQDARDDGSLAGRLLPAPGHPGCFVHKHGADLQASWDVSRAIVASGFALWQVRPGEYLVSESSAVDPTGETAEGWALVAQADKLSRTA